MKQQTLQGLLAELDNLELEELLKVRERADKLIQSKTKSTDSFKSVPNYVTVRLYKRDESSSSFVFSHILRDISPYRWAINDPVMSSELDAPMPVHWNVLAENTSAFYVQQTGVVAPSINQERNKNDMQALDAMIGLVDEWLEEDSGYDESVYPNIEAALIQD